MDYAQGVDVGHTFEDGLHHHPHLSLTKGLPGLSPLLDQGQEVSSLDHLHLDVDATLRFVKVVVLHHIWVVDLGQDTGFLLGTVEPGSFDGVLADDLDGEFFARVPVDALVNLTEGTLA